MNLRNIFSKNVFLSLFACLTILIPNTVAAENPAREHKAETVEIQAGRQRRIEEEAREVKKIPEVREIEKKMPEIPKRITRDKLEGADEVRLAELERKYATGQITEMEYELEKDKLTRESNVTF